MKKLTLALYAVWFSVLFTILSIHSMENHAQFAAQAEKYNADECLLFTLPNDMLFEIFLRCLSNDELSISSLYKDIKYLMPLNSTCKHFNRLITLETRGHLYRNNLNKNKVFEEIITQIYHFNTDKSLPTLAQILLHSGANGQIMLCRTSALEIAMGKNEEKLIATLLKYNADPNVTIKFEPSNPLFFIAETTEIAQILINSGKVNIHATDKFGSNVLRYMLRSCDSLELMKFYLKHKADATKLYSHNHCILHELAWLPFYYNSDIEKFLEKGKILLSAIPYMVNALTTQGKTPIDIAQESFDKEVKSIQSYDRSSGIVERKAKLSIRLEKIITLFRDHGGLTAQELAERKLLDSHK